MDGKNGKIKVFCTQYDGWYVVNENGKISEYEGLGLCPPHIQKFVLDYGATLLDCFHNDAISYGYVD